MKKTFLVLQGLLQDLASASLCLSLMVGFPFAVSALLWIHMPPFLPPQVPLPVMFYLASLSHSSFRPKWLLSQGAAPTSPPWSFPLKHFSLFYFIFLCYIPWVHLIINVIPVVFWHWLIFVSLLGWCVLLLLLPKFCEGRDYACFVYHDIPNLVYGLQHIRHSVCMCWKKEQMPILCQAQYPGNEAWIRHGSCPYGLTI